MEEHDIRRVVNEGRSRAAAEGREPIHALPLTFAVDETDRVADPRGLFCEELTARLHIIDAASTALRSLAACIARCDLHIGELVSAPMAKTDLHIATPGTVVEWARNRTERSLHVVHPPSSPRGWQ